MAASNRTKLTDDAISRLRPHAREYTVWDTRIPGLGVRVRPSGGASYTLSGTTGGEGWRISLGSVTSKGIDEARLECHVRLCEAKTGSPPTRAPERAPVFRDFVEGPWTEAHLARYRPSTRASTRSTLSKRLLPAFGRLRLDDIRRRDVLQWFEAASRTRPGAANAALDLLRQILNFAVAAGHLDANPARGLKRNRRTLRTRFLSRDEVRRLHIALDELAVRSAAARDQADVIRLLLLTGCRRGEIVALRWREVAGDTLALTDAKTGPRRVPLSARASAILDRRAREASAYVFASPRDASRPRDANLPLWYEVRRAARLEDVRLHDLRHTFASHAVMSGVPVPVVSRLLGHSNARMTLRYAHLGDAAVRAEAERIGEVFSRLLSGRA